MSGPGTSGPIMRPYPQHAILSARSFLLKQGHRSPTVKGAEGFNTPLWQDAIARHLGVFELAAAEASARAATGEVK